VGKPKLKRPRGGLGIGRRIILNWTFMGGCGLHVEDLFDSGLEKVSRCCECGNELSSSMK
jgi:hypothetical protein